MISTYEENITANNLMKRKVIRTPSTMNYEQITQAEFMSTTI